MEKQMRATRLLGGILLIAGTAIGAAMLALPVSTGAAGLFPSLILFFVTWSVMTFGALLLVEINLSVDEDANMVSMARETLGGIGAAACWVVYLFLLYSLLTAYLSESMVTFRDIFSALLGGDLPLWSGLIPVLGLFGALVASGTRSVDITNRILMAGLAVSYVVLMGMTAPEIKSERLLHVDWGHLPQAVTVVVTSFGFAIIIPTLRRYFKTDVRALRLAVIIGCAAPLLVYSLWVVAAQGILPLEGPYGLITGFEKGYSGARLMALLGDMLANPWIPTVARGLTFFAIMTSFLGVSLCLMDFLADGMNIQKNVKGRSILYLLTFGPPLLISFTAKRVFLTALEYAGAFGVVTLLVLLPALMAWRGRYTLNYKSLYRAPGGKPALVVAMVFSLVVIITHITLVVGGSHG
jgi:tyrosine-specific transport protein